MSWDSARRLWRAEVTHNRVAYRLGAFPAISDAEAVVVAKRNELFTNNLLDRAKAESRNL